MRSAKMNDRGMFFLLISICMAMTLLTSCQSSAPTSLSPTERPQEVDTEVPQEVDTEVPPEVPEKIWKIGYGAVDLTVDFHIQVTEGIKKVAEEMGVDLLVCDNQQRSGTDGAFDCAEYFVNSEVDGVMSFFCLADVIPAVKEIWDDAGIPVLGLECKHPGAPLFGADNQLAGKIVGEYAANWIKENWADVPQEELHVITFENPAAPVVVLERQRYAAQIIRDTYPDIPDENFIVLSSDALTDTAQAMTGAWIIANPDANHNVIYTMAGSEAIGASNACVIEGRREECAVFTNGSFPGSLTELAGDPSATSIVGDVDYMPLRWGETAVPTMIDILEGKSVPDFVGVPHILLTHENVCELYPEYCQ